MLQFLRRETSSTIDRDSAQLTSASMLDDDDRYMPNALSLRRVCLHILLMFFFIEVMSKSFFRLRSLFCSLRVPLHLLDGRYKNCEPLELVCAQCYKRYAFAGVIDILASLATPSNGSSTSAGSPDPLMCPDCNRSGGLNQISPAMLANQVVLF